jgi:ATP-dependent DNA ligase
MLAESISLGDLPTYIRDDQWVTQLKADGHRLLIRIEDGKVEALGRNGQAKVSGLSHKLLGQFEIFDKGLWVFDGELVGSQLILFDVVHAASYCDPATPFTERYRVLSTLYKDVWKPDPAVIGLMPVAVGPDAKLAMVRSAEQEQREGVMLRHVGGTYRGGGRSPQLLKCKFVKESDCIILRVGDDGKDNVTLALLDPANDTVVEVGRASAIGKRPKPEPLDVWEVKYLYVVDPANPRLYQPRLVRKRTDKALAECLIDQIAGHYTDKDLADKVRENM